MKLWVSIVLVSVVSMAAGCSSLEPWVAPYERANLSDPIMQFSRDAVSDSYIHHVFQAREGARGAEGGAGGGCGCN